MGEEREVNSLSVRVKCVEGREIKKRNKRVRSINNRKMMEIGV